MRDPITKLSIVTEETCNPALCKALGRAVISSARPEKPDDLELAVNVVHFVGKVQRKTRGVMGSDALVLVIGDQAIYLHKMDGELRRCVPISAIASVHVYPNSHIVLRVPTEFDLLLMIEGGTKEKPEAPEVGFVVNVLTVLQDVLFGRRLPAKRAEGNPLDDKDINLKKPDAFQEVNVPLTSLRVPLLKSEVAVESVIRPCAPAATNLQPLTFETINRELSPRAKSLLDHPLLASTRRDEDEDDNTSGSEAAQPIQPPAGASSTTPQRGADLPADDSTDNNSDTSSGNAARALLSPQQPPLFAASGGGAAAAAASSSSAPPMPVAPSPVYVPTVAAPPGILRKPPPLPPGVTPEMARQEEELRRKNDELARRLKQIETMQRAVEQQQVQAMEMVDYVQRVTALGGLHTVAAKEGENNASAASRAVGATAAASSDEETAAATSAAPLPSKFKDIVPAPPSLLSEPRRSPQQQQQSQPDVSPSSALSAYYAQAAAVGKSSSSFSSSGAAGGKGSSATTAATATAAAAAPPPPPALSQQDLQDEVVRRVRSAEDMFAARPPAERSIFRRFHIEQRQRYLSDLQAAMANPGLVKAPPAPAGSFAHFNFAAGSDRPPFPLAVDVFLTQQELLYLLRISQAEAPHQPAGGVMPGVEGEYGWNAAAGDNVFASNQQYSVPSHDPLAGAGGGPLEPLAAHSSPDHRHTQSQQQQQQQLQRGGYPSNGAAAAAAAYGGPQSVYGNPPPQPSQQQQYIGGWQQQQQQQQPAQPAQPGVTRQSPQPRQPMRGSGGSQPIQPVQPQQVAARKLVARRL